MPRCPKCPGMLAQANEGQPCPVCGDPIPDYNAPPPRKIPPIPKCQRCGAQRVVRVAVDADDRAVVAMGEFILEDDYLPDDMGIGDLDFKLCLECGQVQGTWPRPKTELESAKLSDEDEKE